MQIPVRIVLVETSHPGNIGAAARAMKTMGLDELVLVAPRDFPSADATARASGADDVLARARVVDSLGDAIADCGFVAGASARLRKLSWPVADPRAGAAALCEHARHTKVAIVFGPEHSGLTNEDLGRCNQVVHIPANPAYSSLNVAMAVQVLCYELRMAALERPADVEQAARRAHASETPHASTAPEAEPDTALRDTTEATGLRDAAEAASLRDEAEAVGRDTAVATDRRESPPATAAELEGFYRHLESALRAAGFLREGRSKQLKLRLRRIFQRSDLDRNEVNILRGAVAALENDCKEARVGRGVPTALADGKRGEPTPQQARSVE